MTDTTKKRLTWFGIVLLAMLAIILFDSTLLTNAEKIRGGFTETAFSRNENNSGPVIRLYAVKVDSPAVADYEGYGNSMPHTEHGTTKIFFFEGEAPEDLQLDAPHYDTARYRAIWVFQKNAVGKTTGQ